MKNKNLRHHDIRTYQRNVRNGLITDEDHNQFIKGLADEKENAEEISFDKIIEDIPLIQKKIASTEFDE